MADEVYTTPGIIYSTTVPSGSGAFEILSQSVKSRISISSQNHTEILVVVGRLGGAVRELFLEQEADRSGGFL